jgi:hypothetical protein
LANATRCRRARPGGSECPRARMAADTAHGDLVAKPQRARRGSDPVARLQPVRSSSGHRMVSWLVSGLRSPSRPVRSPHQRRHHRGPGRRLDHLSSPCARFHPHLAHGESILAPSTKYPRRGVWLPPSGERRRRPFAKRSRVARGAASQAGRSFRCAPRSFERRRQAARARAEPRPTDPGRRRALREDVPRRSPLQWPRLHSTAMVPRAFRTHCPCRRNPISIPSSGAAARQSARPDQHPPRRSRSDRAPAHRHAIPRATSDRGSSRRFAHLRAHSARNASAVRACAPHVARSSWRRARGMVVRERYRRSTRSPPARSPRRDAWSQFIEQPQASCHCFVIVPRRPATHAGPSPRYFPADGLPQATASGAKLYRSRLPCWWNGSQDGALGRSRAWGGRVRTARRRGTRARRRGRQERASHRLAVRRLVVARTNAAAESACPVNRGLRIRPCWLAGLRCRWLLGDGLARRRAPDQREGDRCEHEPHISMVLVPSGE